MRTGSAVSSLARFIFDSLFFPSCISCGERLPAEIPSSVRRDTPFETPWGSDGPGRGAGVLCPRCWLAMRPAPIPPPEIMPGVPVIAPFETNGPLVSLVRYLKFKGGRSCAQILGVLMARAMEGFTGSARSEVPVLVPVPLHRSRKAARGYNQSSLLAAAAAAELGFEVETDLLKRARRTRPQSKLRGRRRLVNVEGAFSLERPESAAGRRVVLVDDLVTTGCTARACARELLRGHPESVAVLAAGRSADMACEVKMS